MKVPELSIIVGGKQEVGKLNSNSPWQHAGCRRQDSLMKMDAKTTVFFHMI